MTVALQSIDSLDDLFALEPVARFEALIAGPKFDGYLRAEPIESDGFAWPQRDGLKWPHLALVDVLLG